MRCFLYIYVFSDACLTYGLNTVDIGSHGGDQLVRSPQKSGKLIFRLFLLSYIISVLVETLKDPNHVELSKQQDFNFGQALSAIMEPSLNKQDFLYSSKVDDFYDSNYYDDYLAYF